VGAMSENEVLGHGKRVLLHAAEREVEVPVKLRQQNSVKVVLLGEASSELSIWIAYDLRQSR
jgi:hypothetical protein